MNDLSERKKPLPIGESFFDRVIEDGAYYVDKTLFIRDILDNGARVTLCTRPRRFGKTLNQTMLKSFFEDAAPLDGGKDARALFCGLKIEEAGERYMEYQGKYPVIFLSFKEAKFDSFDGSYNVLRECVAEEFNRHAYVVEKISDDYDLKLFKKLSDRAASIGDYSGALKFLCKCLEKYHGKKIIIIIDEYDVPLENSWSRSPRFYDEMINFIRPLLGSAFKYNPHLQFGVMTGCLRVSKESIFTGLNNLDVASVLSKNYSEYFGFTQSEVDAMLDYYGFGGKRQIVRDWYNGYLFGNTEVYNPWSCMFVVRSWMADINEYPKPYWVNTSGNDIVLEAIEKSIAETRAGFETLMAGGTVAAVVNEYATYGEIHKNADNLWNFLLFTGYLKKVSEGGMSEDGERTINLSIPNTELRYVFKTKIREWFADYIKTKDRSLLFNAILSGDAKTVQVELSALLVDYVSYMRNTEDHYHGFTSGVLTGLSGYMVTSEGESGEGRCDLVLYSVNGRDDIAVIFEFKATKDFDDLPTACESALKQIEEKNYAARWKKEGYKSIIKYGIGFCKKRCEVRKGE